MTVTSSTSTAVAVARADGACVLIGEALPPGWSGPGRIALLVGDPADPAVQAAAAAMDAELFGADRPGGNAA